jgi:transposase
MTDSLLRALVDVRDRQVQKARIQFNNRLSAIQNGTDETDGPQAELCQRWLDRFSIIEAELDKDIAAAVAHAPIYEHLSGLRGIGPMLAAKMIALIDIDRAPTVSSLWRYAGYGVVNGEREKPVKGEKLHYNKRLKTTLYLVATSFLRSNSPYRRIYDSAREYYAANRQDWTKGHQHQAAMRKMTKIFLSHLWQTWRELDGLPVTAPYVHDRLGHDSVFEPVEFGW